MANVMFKKGLLASLPTTYTEGTFYVTTDERAIYLDVNDSTRIRLGDFREVATLADLPAAGANVSALYYVADINCLAKWDGSKWIQINRDTGMTSVEIVGAGNAVTGASYDPVTRKLTLTMGETFVKSSEVGTLAGKNEVAENDLNATLKEKVNAAAEGNHSHANKAELDKIAAGDKAKWDAAEQNAKDYADGLATNYDAAGAAKAVQGDTTGTVKSVEDDLAGYKTTNSKAVADAQKAGADAMAEAQKRVASVSAGDNSVTVGGTATAPTIAAKVSQDSDNALELADDGLKVVIPAAAEYSIVKDEASSDFAAIYHLTKDGSNVGAAINIPKDMVVESGSVVTDPEGQPAGTYIRLVLQNVANPLYINVGSLIEYVTSGSDAGDMVVISVSDDHKVTATVTDGSITLTKLAADVQTAIGKAHDHANKSVLDGIDATKVEAWNAAEQNAKDHADDLDTVMDTRVKALEGIDHEAYKAYADQSETDAITAANAYSDGLADNYDAAGAAAAVQGETTKTVKDIVDQMTWGSF